VPLFAVCLAVTRVARETIDIAKAAAEIRKLSAETRKVEAERRKFDVEARKLGSEQTLNELQALRLRRELVTGTPASRQTEHEGEMERWIVTPEQAIPAPPFTTEKRLEQRLSRREALTRFTRATNRLARSGLEIDGLDVEVVTEARRLPK
jgi:hypothetical protein